MKPIKFLLPSFVLCLAAFYSCTDKHTISAEIKGLDNGTVVIRSPLNEEGRSIIDTITAHNGRFIYDITDTSDNVQVYISFPKQSVNLRSGEELQSLSRSIFLVLRPGEKVSIKGSLEQSTYLSYTADGSSFNRDYALDREHFKTAQFKTDSLITLLDSSATMHAPDSIMQLLSDEYRASLKVSRDIRSDYIKQHPDADLSAFYLSMNGLNSFKESYNLLTERVKTGMFSSLLERMQKALETDQLQKEAAKKLIPGAFAPNFTLNSLDGSDVSLSNLKGNYVVLDFWGSWCSWCIKEVPEIKKYYDKYKSKIEFVGVACHDKDDAWREAVSKNNMDWLQLFNSGGSDKNDVTMLYGIQAYPTKIILDKELKVVGVFVGETPDFYKKLDSLLK